MSKTIILMRENGELFESNYSDNHPPFTFDSMLKATEGNEEVRTIMFYFFKLNSRVDALTTVLNHVKMCFESKDEHAMDGVSALSDVFNCISKIHDDEYNFLSKKVKQYEKQH